MEEPTQLHESQFWDHVADWLLSSGDATANVLSREEIAGFARARYLQEASSTRPER